MTPPRSGTIRAESRTRDLDRSDETFAVWERGTQGPIDLPWADATTLAVDRVRGLLDPARMAIVVSAGGRAGTQCCRLVVVLALVGCLLQIRPRSFSP